MAIAVEWRLALAEDGRWALRATGALLRTPQMYLGRACIMLDLGALGRARVEVAPGAEHASRCGERMPTPDLHMRAAEIELRTTGDAKVAAAGLARVLELVDGLGARLPAPRAALVLACLEPTLDMCLKHRLDLIEGGEGLPDGAAACVLLALPPALGEDA